MMLGGEGLGLDRILSRRREWSGSAPFGSTCPTPSHTSVGTRSCRGSLCAPGGWGSRWCSTRAAGGWSLQTGRAQHHTSPGVGSHLSIASYSEWFYIYWKIFMIYLWLCSVWFHWLVPTSSEPIAVFWPVDSDFDRYWCFLNKGYCHVMQSHKKPSIFQSYFIE